MANFGKQTKGGTEAQTSDNIICAPYACPASGTATSITAYLKELNAGAKVKFAIYKVSDDSLVAYSDEWTITSGYDNWKTLNIAWGGALVATDYYLGLWFDTGTYYYHAGATIASVYDSEAYDGFPNPLVPTAWADRDISVYCTYTPDVVPAGRSFGFIIG